MKIYSSPSYGMGADDQEISVPVAPITVTEKKKAESELRRMKRDLKRWLKYRLVNDEDGVSPELSAQRKQTEQPLAKQLYALLSNVFDASKLPDPNLEEDPRAAVKLAKIAVSGQLPGEAGDPEAQGIVWLWPLAIIVGVASVVIITSIRTQAEVAKEQERLACVRAGHWFTCGPFVQQAAMVGAAAIGAWYVWEKLGLKTKVQRAIAGRK